MDHLQRDFRRIMGAESEVGSLKSGEESGNKSDQLSAISCQQKEEELCPCALHFSKGTRRNGRHPDWRKFHCMNRPIQKRTGKNGGIFGTKLSRSRVHHWLRARGLRAKVVIRKNFYRNPSPILLKAAYQISALCTLRLCAGNKKANPEDGRRFTRTTLSAPASGPSCDRSSTQLHRGLPWFTPPIS